MFVGELPLAGVLLHIFIIHQLELKGMGTKSLTKLQKIIVEVLKAMEVEAGNKKMLYGRWLVQEEVCKRYMKHFGMEGYVSEKMSDNIIDHPEWINNPKLNYFFIVEQGTDLQGKPYRYLKNASSFSTAFFKGIIALFKVGLVTIDTLYQRKKAGCCGYVDSGQKETVHAPSELKDIQRIGLTEKANAIL